MEDKENFIAPTQQEIVAILRAHPLIRLKGKVLRSFLVGSFAKNSAHDDSDVDILLEVEPIKGIDEATLENDYRKPLQRHFMLNNIRGKDDSVHPQWQGRRVDLYFTYDAELETRPKIELSTIKKIKKLSL